MRDAWERAMDDLAYSVDVLCERFGLTPAGGRDRHVIEYDWDTSMIESTTEAFTQNMELHAAGMVSDAEMRQWVRGGTLEENQAAIEEIRKERKQENPISKILSEPDEDGEE